MNYELNYENELWITSGETQQQPAPGVIVVGVLALWLHVTPKLPYLEQGIDDRQDRGFSRTGT